MGRESAIMPVLAKRNEEPGTSRKADVPEVQDPGTWGSKLQKQEEC